MSPTHSDSKDGIDNNFLDKTGLFLLLQYY